MKFVTQASEFLEALKIAARAVSTQNTLPVLGNVLLKAENQKVYLSSTNLDLSILTSFNAEVLNEGAITIPAKTITAYISLIQKSEDIEVAATDGTALSIKSKGSKTKIKGISAEEFPSTPVVEDGHKWTMKLSDFRQSVSRVAFCAQENAVRPILGGVYFLANETELIFVATDTYRLSEQKIELLQSVESATAVIPVRAVVEADRLATGEDEITICVSENQATFIIGETRLTTRLIEGHFPDYTQIIPKEQNTKVVINRAELAMAVRRVSIFAKENNGQTKFEFGLDGQVLVYTDSTEIGEERVKLQAEVEGDSNNIALNADYVLDILNAFSGSEDCQIQMNGAQKPAICKLPDQKFLHLIMPLEG